MTSSSPLPGTILSRSARAGVRRPAPARAASRSSWVVLGAAAVVVALRLRYVAAPMSPDEGGFLTVAAQWGHGSSLYGDYWVDRPPLLIALFRMAVLGGGVTALRVIGCIAAAVAVVATGAAVRRVAGPVAAGTAAVVVAGLLASPLDGAIAVNGELLAAPFIAVGLWLAVEAVAERVPRRGVLLAAAAGAAGAAAVLVKQNMLDVGVFAVVALVAAARSGQLPVAVAGRRLGALVAGALGATVGVLGLAWLAGSSPGSVVFAMYAFRLRAAGVMATHDTVSRIAHLQSLGVRELATIGIVPVLVLLLLLWTRRRTARESLVHPIGIATVVLACYDVVSIVLGGSYWGHYLVQLAAASGLACGLVVRWHRRTGAVLAVAVMTSALLSWTLGQGLRVGDSGEQIGAALRASSVAGDTVVPLLGDSDLVQQSGLHSPYPYLWSLPARTLDPHLTELNSVLAGPHAPTWVVVRGPTTQAWLDRHAAGKTLQQRYHLVAQPCGRRVLLLNGVTRTTPVLPGTCSATLAGPTRLDPRSP